MPNTRQRRQARVRKRLKAELAGQAVRQQGRIEAAITSTALRLGTSKEDTATILPATLDVWNETADSIEREFGKGWFPLRLERVNAFSFRFVDADGASLPSLAGLAAAYGNRLTYLAAIKADPRPYQLMNDLLFMACTVPEDRIVAEASGRDSWWHRIGRKRRENIALAQHKAHLGKLDDERQFNKE